MPKEDLRPPEKKIRLNSGEGKVVQSSEEKKDENEQQDESEELNDYNPLANLSDVTVSSKQFLRNASVLIDHNDYKEWKPSELSEFIHFWKDNHIVDAMGNFDKGIIVDEFLHGEWTRYIANLKKVKKGDDHEGMRCFCVFADFGEEHCDEDENAEEEFYEDEDELQEDEEVAKDSSDEMRDVSQKVSSTNEDAKDNEDSNQISKEEVSKESTKDSYNDESKDTFNEDSMEISHSSPKSEAKNLQEIVTDENANDPNDFDEGDTAILHSERIDFLESWYKALQLYRNLDGDCLPRKYLHSNCFLFEANSEGRGKAAHFISFMREKVPNVRFWIMRTMGVVRI
mgnify:CR=1 FL=1